MKTINVFILMLMTAHAFAEPKVVADFGGRETGLQSPQELLREAMRSTPVPEGKIPDGLAKRYPIESSMTVDIIEPYAHHKSVARPFFIVGADQQSAQWLSANHAHLKQINALGLVTNVQSEQQLQKLQGYAGDLTLHAMPVDAIAEQLELQNYPVLVTQEEVTQ